MAPQYDISNPSDMRRFERDLKEAAIKEAKKQIDTKGLAVVCPKCHNAIHVQIGKNICPICKTELNYHLEG